MSAVCAVPDHERSARRVTVGDTELRASLDAWRRENAVVLCNVCTPPFHVILGASFAVLMMCILWSLFPQASHANDEGDGTLPVVVDDDAPASHSSGGISQAMDTSHCLLPRYRRAY